MTVSKKTIRKRLGKARDTRLFTFAGETIKAILEARAAATGLSFPLGDEYRRDPVKFATEILGVTLWRKQREVLQALVTSKRVAVRSGHKIGKSRLAICAALWFFCCFPGARVLFTSTTAAQVDRILWRELRMVRAMSPHASAICEDPPELARTGVRSQDFREIWGFSSKESEAVAGISGSRLFYIVDEASGVSHLIFEAMNGNMMAAGAKMLMLGNPTRNEGAFFDAFHGGSELWTTFTISSEETPNCTGEEEPIPGLADPVEIAAFEREHGRNSAWFQVRVLGKHALGEDGKIFSVAMISEAEERYEDAVAEGRLCIGVDPAGPSGRGDDCAIVPRRGRKALEIVERKGLDEHATVTEIMSLVHKYRVPNSDHDDQLKPLVVVDGGGEYGVKLARALHEFAHRTKLIEVCVVLMSDAAVRDVRIYDRMRDLLAANLREWLLDGGAIPTSNKLEAELHLWEWRTRVKDGKQKLHPEKDGQDGARRKLGRSPDRYDALALACWVPSVLESAQLRQEPTIRDVYDTRVGPETTPKAEWSGAESWDDLDNTASGWGHR